MSNWKNRIVRTGTQPAGEFLANPGNWRIHPKNQRDALRGVLGEVGWVTGVIVNKTTGHMLDGHARVEEALKLGDETPVPFIEVELTEAEEKTVLATFDPISAMAAADKEQLDALLHDVSTASEGVQSMLTELAEKNGLEYGATIGGTLEDAEPDTDDMGEVDDAIAPFPWFGGKSRVAGRIWQRFGQVDNYVEPFLGSAAVLLACPFDIKTRTVNDADGFVANFWRALEYAPDEVAKHVDWPVNEADLMARHIALVNQRGALTKKLETQPKYFDAELAGWWCWGACAWIGTGWCDGDGPWMSNGDEVVRSGNAGRGVNRQLPHLGDAGQGVNRQLPHLGDAGQGDRAVWSKHIAEYMNKLADRLRRVRVCCGDWSRVVTPSVTTRHGMTAVLLDPPYGEGAQEYSVGGNASKSIASDVWQWAVENGKDPQLKIAVCGYDDGRKTPPGWTAMRWSARKGYQVSDASKDNPDREMVWFSPNCERVTEVTP